MMQIFMKLRWNN